MNKNTNNEYVFKMGKENVIIEATWKEGDYVARIMDTYYPTIQAAFDDVDSKDWDDNTVWLLRNTTEYPTNNARNPFIFNLDTHTVTGTITNSNGSDITLVNGTIKAEDKLTEEEKEGLADNKKHEAAVINNGTVKVGIDDGFVNVENSITLIGNEYGLINNGRFEFYDGYLEGESGFSSFPNKIADRHMILSETKEDGEKERVYLSPTPNRAVAEIVQEGTNVRMCFYNLQNAFRDSNKFKNNDSEHNTDNDYIVSAIRDFEAAYPITVDEDERVIFDTAGYDIETGESITNNGYLKIYNSDTNKTTISSSVSITNNKNLVIDNISIKSTTDDNVINNKSNITLSKNLTISRSLIEGKNGYGISNTDNGSISLDGNTVIKSQQPYAIYNSTNTLSLDNGTIYGIRNTGTLKLDENVNVLRPQDITSNITYYTILNSGTINVTGGKVSDDTNNILISNSGTINTTGGTIESKGTSISGGTVNVKGGTITSETTAIDSTTVNVTGGLVQSTNNAIKASTVTVSNGEVTSENGTAISASNATISGGEISSENSRGVSVEYTLNMTGGKVTAGTVGLYGNLVNISGGEVISDDIGAQAYTYYTYYRVEHPGIVTINNSEVHVEGKNYGVYTDYIELSDGLVTSSENIGVAVNKNGNVVGGVIHGATYGLLNNSKVTIGVEDDEIGITTPEIIGDSYGLYVPEGKETNFNDGILKGTIDGYSGVITNTPLGAVTVDGNDTINGVEYETDYLIIYENWLRVGTHEFNNTTAASRYIQENDIEEDTIEVIKSVDDITFKQESLGWGDIKLAFFVGIVLGIKLGVLHIFIGAFLALPYALFVTYKNKGNILPFGPFLITAFFILFHFQDWFSTFISTIYRGIL